MRVGQAVRRFFPDGQLYVDLRQEEPAGALGRRCGRWGRRA
ncbi:protein of unknown function [Streptomyces murinus]